MVRKRINVDDISPNPSIHPEIYQLAHNSEHLSVHVTFRCESSHKYTTLACALNLKKGGGEGGPDGSFDVDNPRTYEWIFSS